MLITNSQPTRTAGLRTIQRQVTNPAHTPIKPQVTFTPAGSETPATSDPFPPSLDQEVIDLTRRMVRVDSTPSQIPHGESAVVDVAVDFATKAGLEISRTTTVNDRPMLVVTLPGNNL